MKRKFAIVGCGKLGRVVAQAWLQNKLPDYQLVGVYSRSFSSALEVAKECKVEAYSDLNQLLQSQKPELVVETASVEAVLTYGQLILESGADLALISIGALADAQFRTLLEQVAREQGRKIYLASGAIGGFDVMRTLMQMGATTATIHSVTGPQALCNTPIYNPTDPQPEDLTTKFTGTALEAIALLPRRVNVAVAASLATTGPEQFQVKISCQPNFEGDTHTINVEGPGVSAICSIYSQNSEIAGYSIVALLNNLTSVIQFQ